MTGFLAAVSVLLPFAEPDLSFPLPPGADLRIAHPSRTHGPGCRAAVFSRGGAKLATMSDRTVLVRSWPNGRRLLEFHYPKITSSAGLAFSPDGRRVAAWEVGFSSVHLADLRTGADWRVDSQRSDHDRFALSHVAFVSNGVLRVFGERLTDRLSPTGNFEAVDFEPERETPVARNPLPGQPLAIAADGTAAILKVGEELRRYGLTVHRLVGKPMPLPANNARDVAADAECLRIAYTGPNELFVVDTRTGERLLTADLSPWAGAGWTTPYLSSDGTELAAINRVMLAPPLSVKRWDVATGKARPDIRDTINWNQPAAIACSETVAVFDADGQFAQFARATGKPLGPLTRPILFALSPGGRRLASDDGQFEVRNAITAAATYSDWNTDPKVRDAGRRGQFGVTDDGRRVFVEDPKRTVAFGRQSISLRGERLQFSNGGDWGREPKPQVRIVPLPPKDEREWGETFQLAASADGRTLAVARHTHVDLFDSEVRHLRRIQIIPLRDRETQQLWSDIHESVTGVALSADGRRVAIGKHTSVRGKPVGTEFFIHEVATGGPVAHIDGVYGTRTPLGFTPNGRHLWSAGDGVALRYDLKPPRLPVFDRKNLLLELRGENAALAHLAAGRLASPGMLAWFGEQLPPDTKPDATKVAEWIRQLNDRDFNTREAATAALVAMGPGVSPALREVLKAPPSAEARRRAEVVLNRVNGESAPDVLLKNRAVTAVAVIAEDGTPAARKLLEAWAKGDPGLPLTESARAALPRLPK